MLICSAHGLRMLLERDIEQDWVRRAVDEPDIIEPDPNHPDRTRVFRVLPERDGRCLRVVYVRQEHHVRLITLFLVRGLRRKR